MSIDEYLNFHSRLMSQTSKSINSAVADAFSSQKRFVSAFSEYFSDVCKSYESISKFSSSLSLLNSSTEILKNQSVTDAYFKQLNALSKSITSNIHQSALKAVPANTISEFSSSFTDFLADSLTINNDYNHVLANVKGISDSFTEEKEENEDVSSDSQKTVNLSDGKTSIQVPTAVIKILAGVLETVLASFIWYLISLHLPQSSTVAEEPTVIQADEYNQLKKSFDSLSVFIFSLNSSDPEAQAVIESVQAECKDLRESLPQSESALCKSDSDPHISECTPSVSPHTDSSDISNSKSLSEE